MNGGGGTQRQAASGLGGGIVGSNIGTSAPLYGGGTISIKNTIVAMNSATVPPLMSVAPDTYGTVLSLGHNICLTSDGGNGFIQSVGDIVGTNPNLGPLADNGGPTLTMALLSGSPAIDSGDPANAPATDQRGFVRIFGGTIDIGAFEAQSPNVAVSSTTLSLSVNPPAAFQPFTITATVSGLLPGLPTPTSMVQFTIDNGAPTSVALNGAGKATLSLPAGLASGQHSIVAAYVGDTNFGGSTASLSISVPIPAPGTLPSQSIAGRNKATGQWFVGVSNGSAFSTSTWGSWSPATTWVDVVTGDFNGDGKTDIAGRDQATGIWYVASSNGSSFTTTQWGKWNPAVTWVDVMVGDFNGDGKADIVGRVLESGGWWVAESTGSSFTNFNFAGWNPNVTWVDVKVGDFNGDGKSDIIGRVLQNGQWWVTEPFISTSLWATWSPAVTWADVQVGDLNGDGKSDIVGRVLQNGQWWAGLSTGASFNSSLWDQWSSAVTWVDVHLADMNGDGRADIVGRVLQSGQWWVGLSNSSGFSTTLWATWNPGVTWVDVQVGDFNGDGKADISGRAAELGFWYTGISNGSTAFVTSLWAMWNPAVNWANVQHGNFA
jgi:hypothetical protein